MNRVHVFVCTFWAIFFLSKEGRHGSVHGFAHFHMDSSGSWIITFTLSSSSILTHILLPPSFKWRDTHRRFNISLRKFWAELKVHLKWKSSRHKRAFVNRLGMCSPCPWTHFERWPRRETSALSQRQEEKTTDRQRVLSNSAGHLMGRKIDGVRQQLSQIRTFYCVQGVECDGTCHSVSLGERGMYECPLVNVGS